MKFLTTFAGAADSNNNHTSVTVGKATAKQGKGVETVTLMGEDVATVAKTAAVPRHDQSTIAVRPTRGVAPLRPGWVGMADWRLALDAIFGFHLGK